MERVQSLAAMTIGRVLSGRSLDVELLTLWRKEEGLTIQERGAIQDITFGVLRHLGYVDAILSQLLQKPLTDSLVRNILQVAIYQLQHANNKTYTIVDHAVTASIRLGFPQARGLVNGVLRNFIRRQKELEKRLAELEEMDLQELRKKQKDIASDIIDVFKKIQSKEGFSTIEQKMDEAKKDLNSVFEKHMGSLQRWKFW